MWRVAFFIAVIGCGAAPKRTEPEPTEPVEPEKPAEKPAEKPVAPKSFTDCAPTTANDVRSPVPFNQRSISEAERLAREAWAEAMAAESADVGSKDRDQFRVAAIRHSLDALYADPYNVVATYALAATYAEVGAKQCSINMLVRLGLLLRMASLRDEVNLRLDRLLGRNKSMLDPSFGDMRGEDAFRSVVRGIISNAALEIPPAIDSKPISIEVAHPKPLPAVPLTDDAPAKVKPPSRPETTRLSVKVLEVKPSGTGIAFMLDCSAGRLTVGAKGSIVASGSVAGSLSITAVRGKECRATSTMPLSAYPQGAVATFEVPTVE